MVAAGGRVVVGARQTNWTPMGSPRASGRHTSARRLDKPPKQRDRSHVQRAGERDKLDDVDTALAVLAFGDEGLRSAQFCGERLLRQARVFARCAEQLEEKQLFGRPGGPADASGRREATQDELIRRQNYPIKGSLTVFVHSLGKSLPVVDFQAEASERGRRRRRRRMPAGRRRRAAGRHPHNQSKETKRIDDRSI